MYVHTYVRGYISLDTDLFRNVLCTLCFPARYKAHKENDGSLFNSNGGGKPDDVEDTSDKDGSKGNCLQMLIF